MIHDADIFDTNPSKESEKKQEIKMETFCIDD